MRQASIFVSPARYEPFGLTVLEAARAGCALVLSDIPTFRELWSGAALFVDPSRPDELAAALRYLAENAGVLEAMQQAAKARARLYSLDSTVGAYADLYESLLTSSSADRIFDRWEAAV